MTTDPVWNVAGLELDWPERLVQPGAWVGHIPVAFFLVEALRPLTFVELGVHTGNSYCAFAQAVAKLGLATRCFGVDHWKGDDQASFYGESVFDEIKAYHDPRYGHFSTLLRMTFDDARSRFSDGDVDLLHIDGYHPYEAVKLDFETWLPKLSSGGVVILHDVSVHAPNFGVWALWEEIQGRFPTFTFPHSNGLGVAYVGSDAPPTALKALLDVTGDERAMMQARLYFDRLGAAFTCMLSGSDLAPPS